MNSTGEPLIPQRQVERLSLGLAVSGGQVDPRVPPADDLALQVAHQVLAVSAAAVPVVGPDPFQLGGGVVEPAEGTTGDRLVVEQPDEQAAVWRVEFLARVGPQPGVHPGPVAAVAVGVLHGELVDERRGQRVVLTDRDEAQLTHRRFRCHTTI